MNTSSCELCSGTGGRLIHDDGRLRVVVVDEADYPGFIRVIWNAHAREMTDLPPPDRAHLMQVVFAVERLQREVLRPHKMNLASLGNVTPHVHWHLIPRFADDAHYPGPIWGERKRTTAQEALAARRSRIESLVGAVVGELRAGG
jgi:diadenosine tetraphosphate (Ap4A) HIT family hydrolase